MNNAYKKMLRSLTIAGACLAVACSGRAICKEECPAASVKRILVNKTTFSDVYPAVWFSPSSGDISPLTENSETPPKKKYEIWIEPRDPEFAFGPGRERENVGFLLVGKGKNDFQSASIPDDAKLAKSKLAKRLSDLKKLTAGGKLPVFYCKAANSECFIMITTLDTEKEMIGFRWRPLE